MISLLQQLAKILTFRRLIAKAVGLLEMTVKNNNSVMKTALQYSIDDLIHRSKNITFSVFS